MIIILAEMICKLIIVNKTCVKDFLCMYYISLLHVKCYKCNKFY